MDYIQILKVEKLNLSKINNYYLYKRKIIFSFYFLFGYQIGFYDLAGQLYCCFVILVLYISYCPLLHYYAMGISSETFDFS